MVCGFALSLIILLSGCSSVSNKEDQPLAPELTTEKQDVIEGGIIRARLRLSKKFHEKNVSVTGAMVFKNGNKIPIKYYPLNETTFVALVGVEFGVEAGPLEIEATVCSRANISVDKSMAQDTSLCETVRKPVTITKGVFASEKLTVAPRKVTPTKKDRFRIMQDIAVLKKVYAASENKIYFEAPVLLPIDSLITSQYGSHRVYNGKHTNAHLGTDFRAEVGTPILTPLTGKVVLSQDLFYTGNTVILDHGYDFFTIYAHLSKLQVKAGQVVQRGEVMGLSGATGRVSGPHVHWGVRLHGQKVDAMALVSLLK